MKSRILFLAIGLSASLLAAAGPATAEDRFVAVETDGATIRIDKQSGDVTYCRPSGSNLVCRPAADERKAWLDEMDALQKRVDALEEKLSAVASADLPPKLDPEEESAIDKAMKTTETVVKRLMAMLKELQQNEQSTN